MIVAIAVTFVFIIDAWANGESPNLQLQLRDANL